MSHPFGDKITEHLSRKHGLSQYKLADGIGQKPSVIADMCHGRRLTGPLARERVRAIIEWLVEHGALHWREEADALLAAAGMSGLNPDAESDLVGRLKERNSNGQVEPPPEPLPVLRGNVPPLPALLIGREQALHELIARLQGVPTSSNASRMQVLTAMRGWPGVGKTTLAAALAHEPGIAALFPDGVLWASLGQSPQLLSELAAWGRALGTDEIGRAQSIEEASTRLAALLRPKRVLLILDDVWETEHAQPFLVGGHGCAMLVTTRLPLVAQALAPTPDDVYKLAVLTNDQALELLRRLAPAVVRQHPQQSLELVRELEGLPLAVQVAGRLLQTEASYGWDVTDLLAELRSGTVLMQAEVPAELSQLASETSPTVAVLLHKSTARLDERTRTCFAQLGSFAPKPATFDLGAMKFMWQVRDARPIVRTLVDRGLLEHVGSTRYQMHALLVLHARSMLRE